MAYQAYSAARGEKLSSLTKCSLPCTSSQTHSMADVPGGTMISLPGILTPQNYWSGPCISSERIKSSQKKALFGEKSKPPEVILQTLIARDATQVSHTTSVGIHLGHSVTYRSRMFLFFLVSRTPLKKSKMKNKVVLFLLSPWTIPEYLGSTNRLPLSKLSERS